MLIAYRYLKYNVQRNVLAYLYRLHLSIVNRWANFCGSPLPHPSQLTVIAVTVAFA